MSSAPRNQGGFTYLALLFFVAIFGATTAAVGVYWSVAQKREKERELLFRGEQIRRAIASFYERTPGTVKRYPTALTDLVKDNRHLGMVRHLRRVYNDPITGKDDWGIVRAEDGGIKGVYSLSTDSVLKQVKFDLARNISDKETVYADWKFIYEPPRLSQ